jgi:hypothetical protein
MGSSSAPQPKVITPGEAAQAAVGTAGAGEMMSIANQPIEQYANLYTTQQLGPAQMQTQQALANQAAYQGASAQQDIQSRVDPLAYAQRQMRLKAATDRLGQLYGQDPSAFSFRAPGAYAIPGTSDVASLPTLRGAASDIAANLATGSVDKSGTNPRLQIPAGTALRTPTTSQSYF